MTSHRNTKDYIDQTAEEKQACRRQAPKCIILDARPGRAETLGARPCPHEMGRQSLRRCARCPIWATAVRGVNGLARQHPLVRNGSPVMRRLGTTTFYVWPDGAQAPLSWRNSFHLRLVPPPACVLLLLLLLLLVRASSAGSL